jgi:SAM-dependent methyltransferase
MKKMMTHSASILERANEEIGASVDRAVGTLSELAVDELGLLLLDVPTTYPELRRVLPRMPADDVQRAWTGHAGVDLLRQSCAYVKSVELAFCKYVNRPLKGAAILDYGCGWGRLIRLMYHYSPPGKLYGVDPWDQSIELCRTHGLMGNLAICDYVPDSLPFGGDVKFDLIHAFSVFTHLSERTAMRVLRVMRSSIKDSGLLALTIRPMEYWDVHGEGFPAGLNAEAMKSRHMESGYAFIPHGREPVDGDITYGDTSISFDYIRRNWSDWRLVGYDFNSCDSHQLIVFLQPQ